VKIIFCLSGKKKKKFVLHYSFSNEFSQEILNVLQEWKQKDPISSEEYELAEKIYLDFMKYPVTDEQGNPIDYQNEMISKEETLLRKPERSSSIEADPSILGNDALEASAFDLAIDYFNRAIQKNPNHITSWNNLSLAYLKRAKDDHDLKQVINACDRVIQLDPSAKKVIFQKIAY
jgi:tetratricopeptide (TPR) repeat protein